MGRAERRKEEHNINHAKSTGADACSILTFVEDGRMFYKLLDHRDRYPESTPDLMLTILPFCALAAHDSVRFVKKFLIMTSSLIRLWSIVCAMHQNRFLPRDRRLKTIRL